MNRWILISAAAILAGCASQKFYGSDTDSTNGEPGKSLRSQMLWSKNKSNSIDVSIRLVNEYPHPVVVKTILLDSGGVKVGADRNMIELQPGQSAEPVFIFHSTARTRTDTNAKLTMAVQKGTADNTGESLPEVMKTFRLCGGVGNMACD